MGRIDDGAGAASDVESAEQVAVPEEPDRRPSLGPEYFARFYDRAGSDPWGFTTRWYEERKRALTLAALPRPLFRRGFEVGCSVGVLTAGLAGRCEDLLAIDVVEEAVVQARTRTAGLAAVRVEQGSALEHWPRAGLDLIVLSEVGYYFDREDLAQVLSRASASLSGDGVLVACHWRHPVADYPLTGDTVHAQVRATPGLTVLAAYTDDDFLLDVLVRSPGISVAEASGLLG